MIWFFGGIFFAQAEELQGKVLEQGTDIPLQVQIQCSETIVYADADGGFRINGACETLWFISPNHYPAEVLALELEKKKLVYLQPKITQEEIIIEEERLPTHSQTYSLLAEDLERTPGGFDDPIRLLQSLPGLIATREYGKNAGELLLRGAPSAESKVFIDGIEVPYLYHFDQYASVLPTSIVDSVMVYPSNFGATYGDAVGGVVALESKEADMEKPHFLVQGNPIMAGILYSKPLETGVVSISGRRSFADLYESSNEQYSLWPTFSDYIARYDHYTAEGHHLRFTALGAMDRYGRYIRDVDQLDPYEQSINPNLESKRRYDGGVFRWDWRTPDYRLKTSAAFLRDDWSATLEADNQRRIDNYSWLRHESVMIEEWGELSVGFDQRLGRIHQLVQASMRYPEISLEAPWLARGESLDEVFWQWRPGGWVEPRWNFGNWRLITGLRGQAVPLRAQYSLDPRVQLFFRNEQLAWSLAGGVYHQAPPTFFESIDAQATSMQASTGWEIFSDKQKLGIDIWGRETENKIVAQVDSDPILAVEQGLGAEIFYQLKLGDAFLSQISVSSVNSTIVSNGARYKSIYHQPFSLNTQLAWNNDNWIAGLRYRYSMGLPTIEATGAVYQANSDSYTAIWENFPSGRMPDYQKWDAQLARIWKRNDWEFKGYCEVWYVPSRSNFLYPIYNFNYTEKQLVVGPPFVPLIGFSAQK